jgi:Spy/CpxP family protein refolding chaperone
MKLSWKTLGLSVICVSVLIAMTAAVVVSQGPGDFRRGPGPRGGGLPFLRNLNLTDDQKAEIKKIMDSEAASTKDLHDKMRTLHESEPDPFSTTFDEGAVRAAAEARAKIDVELQVSHAKTMSQIANLLTAEQRAQLAARKSQFHQGPPPPPEP